MSLCSSNMSVKPFPAMKAALLGRDFYQRTPATHRGSDRGTTVMVVHGTTVKNPHSVEVNVFDYIHIIRKSIPLTCRPLDFFPPRYYMHTKKVHRYHHGSNQSTSSSAEYNSSSSPASPNPSPKYGIFSSSFCCFPIGSFIFPFPFTTVPFVVVLAVKFPPPFPLEVRCPVRTT